VSLTLLFEPAKPTFEKVYSTTFFDHLSANPELSEQFNAAMRQGTTLSAQQLLQHYDFGKFRTIADIGGGDGTLLAEVLQAYPSLRGILFDTAAGLAEANRTLTGANVVDRCAIRVGNFLAAAPEGADVYLLKSVLQDWDDDRAGVILGHIRRVHSRWRAPAHYRTGVARCRRCIGALFDVSHRFEHVGQPRRTGSDPRSLRAALRADRFHVACRDTAAASGPPSRCLRWRRTSC